MGRTVSADATRGGEVPEVFRDRREAGLHLSRALAHLKGHPGLTVVAIPRGGVPVGYEVAMALGAPLDVVIVRKLGHPSQPELAMGAVASGGFLALNPEVAATVSAAALASVEARERRELERREQVYRGGREALNVTGKLVILVDDGLATGASARVAIEALRALHPLRLLLAVPVAPVDTAERMRSAVDEFVCLIEAEEFYGVGQWYLDFSPTSDAEVQSLLAAAAAR